MGVFGKILWNLSKEIGKTISKSTKSASQASKETSKNAINANQAPKTTQKEAKNLPMQKTQILAQATPLQNTKSTQQSHHKQKNLQNYKALKSTQI